MILKHDLKRETSSNITAEEASSYCNTSLSNIPATNFSHILSRDDIDAKINECAFDVKAYQDYSAVYPHIEALNNIVKVELEKDPVFVTSHTDEVSYFLENSCENNCSRNGVCSSQGSCICDDTYSGSDCSIDITEGPVIDYVTAYGFCDVSYQPDCLCFDVLTTNLLKDFKCKSQEFLVDITGTQHPNDPDVYDGSYLTVFEGECCFPTSRQHLSSVEGGFYTHYSLSISNDETNYGELVSIFIYDSTCQQNITNATGHISFDVKAGFCFIDGICVADKQANTDTNCHICDMSTEKFNWTFACQTPLDSNEDTNYLPIAMVFCVIASIVVVVVLIFLKKLGAFHRRRPQQPDAHAYDRDRIEPYIRREDDISSVFVANGSPISPEISQTSFGNQRNVNPIENSGANSHVLQGEDSVYRSRLSKVKSKIDTGRKRNN